MIYIYIYIYIYVCVQHDRNMPDKGRVGSLQHLCPLLRVYRLRRDAQHQRWFFLRMEACVAHISWSYLEFSCRFQNIGWKIMVCFWSNRYCIVLTGRKSSQRPEGLEGCWRSELLPLLQNIYNGDPELVKNDSYVHHCFSLHSLSSPPLST